MDIEEYFKAIDVGVQKAYKVANAARAKGFDPANEVEIPIATTLAEKAVGLISVLYPQINDKRIVNRILELEEKYGQLDIAVAFLIAEEVAKQKYCKFEDLMQAIDAGIRLGFSYFTLGVVSSPIEGFTGLKLGKTRNGEDYFKAYFSGPIRSAGTTASCVVLMLIDYLRESFGFAKYDPTEEEVKRYVSENYDYHERVTNLQYLPTEEELDYLARGLPIQIAGEPTEDREVFNYKDLARVETNFIRGGMCLIFSEGLAQKAKKGSRLLKSFKAKGFTSTGWDYLDGYLELHEKRETGTKKTTATYMSDLVAGRPIFSHPSRSGGFRFRYGRSRTAGFSATLVHPATMMISGSFLSNGTQLKIEKPTKGCAISVCDYIDGPIVKLRNGSVRKLSDADEAKKIYRDVSEIIYLGDLLFPFGDVLNRNSDLLKPGYVEEWWNLELEKACGKGLDDAYMVDFFDAVNLSKKYGLALHPNYIYYWNEIDKEQFLGLVDWLARGAINDGKLVLPFAKSDSERFAKGKRALELVGCEHLVYLDNVILEKKYAEGLLFNLGIVFSEGKLEERFEKVMERIKEFEVGEQEGLIEKGEGKWDVLKCVNGLCDVVIKDKSGTFIGARMGRPEKAKLRKLTGSPHVLFPVGEQGGRLRSFQAAIDVGFVKSSFPNYFCERCSRESVYRKCDVCGEFCTKGEEQSYGNEIKIDIRDYFLKARKISGLGNDEVPIVIKGVKGTSNEDHSCEHLVKGFLRAKHNLHVNKDGTVRYDMTEMAVTHFKPREVGTSVEKLRELGYNKDIYGRSLESEEQILGLFPHDVILPACPDSADEKADDVFFKISKFVDDELERLYGLDKYYNAEKKGDLVGELVVCIAPHICTATVGRLIGFSKVQALMATPYMHAAMRRDCDGDEAATMLLMDLLLNFSRKFLPAHRGGTQDAALVLNTQIRAGEVDDQILDVVLGKYPLELYTLAEEGKHSSEVKIETVKTRLKNGSDPFTNISFSHPCTDFNAGVVNSSYKGLPTMGEKVDEMMLLCEKLRAVDTSDTARLMIERHFIRDTRGNLRKFSMQQFRCVGCNAKYRRTPLRGGCTKCGGRLIFTISEGSVLKYMQRALDLARKYKVNKYLIESLELTEMYIHSIFGKEKERQEALGKWF